MGRRSRLDQGVVRLRERADINSRELQTKTLFPLIVPERKVIGSVFDWYLVGGVCEHHWYREVIERSKFHQQVSGDREPRRRDSLERRLQPATIEHQRRLALC